MEFEVKRSLRRGVSVYRIIHEPYLMEWLTKNYPPGTWMVNVPLGTIRPELLELARTPGEIRALKGWRANADAVVILSKEVHIIEAFIRTTSRKIEQLLDYVELFKVTPEFREHWDKKIVPILLTPLDHPWYEFRARQHGIRIIKYRPDWIIPYLNSIERKQARGFLSGIKPPES